MERRIKETQRVLNHSTYQSCIVEGTKTYIILHTKNHMIVNIIKLHGLPEKNHYKTDPSAFFSLLFFLQILEGQPSMIRYLVN